MGEPCRVSDLESMTDDLFAQGDVQGLLSLLHAARPKTAFAAAEYLGQIGDVSSLSTLQSFLCDPTVVAGIVTDVRGSVRPCLGERTLTDADGRFAVLKRCTNLICYASNMEGAQACVFSCEGFDERAEIEIRLKPLATFTDRVLDCNNVPIDNVAAYFDLSVPRFDYLDGSYSGCVKCRIFIFDGRFRLEVPVGLRQTLMVSTGGCRGQADPIDPASGRTYDLGDIVLQPRMDPNQ